MPKHDLNFFAGIFQNLKPRSKIETNILKKCSFMKNYPLISNSSLITRSRHSDKDEKFQVQNTSRNEIHLTSAQQYPAAESLSLPSNVEDIASSEKSRFSPLRNRDISGSVISSMTSANLEAKAQRTSQTDERVQSYDCSGAVSLSSAMQTNVPDPFCSKGKSTYLNMPGGQWRQGEKYMSEELNNSHHVNTRGNRSVGVGSSISDIKKNSKNTYFLLSNQNFPFGLTGLLQNSGLMESNKFYSTGSAEELEKVPTDKNLESKTEPVKINRKEKLKAAFKEYGVVVVIFHIGVALISLGTCYLLIISGLDLSKVLDQFGASEGAATAAKAAPFVIAYALHKTTAGFRIFLTITAVPYIVRHFRKIGLFKGPKVKP